MTEIYLEVKGLEEITRKLADLPGEIRGPIATKMLTDAGLEVERQAKERAPVDTGRLRSSITTEVRDLEARIGSNVQYAASVELGSSPHFPPPLAIEGWVWRHRQNFGMSRGGRNMARTEQVGQIAYLIMRKIAAHGTKPRPYLVPGFEAPKPAIEGHIAEAGEAIADWWNTQ